MMKHLIHLQLVGSELGLYQKQMMLVNKMAMFLNKHYKAPLKKKYRAESIVELPKSIRREIA